ncbi:MAG: M20 family metallopeptidase [Deltaproteobacteria bacterium]|nr:M20 family metallopeptidase [Deltaproteobacteria bacterium]
MDTSKLLEFVGDTWDHSIVPALIDYIRIPNKSPAFDPAWRENGHMKRAVDLVAGWCRSQPIEGMTVKVLEAEGRTPLVMCDIPATTKDREDTVLLYGHLDKQPEMVGWAEGLGPWTPVIRGDKLFGRGGADDGYSAFASLTAIRALREQRVPHARAVVLIEATEESGSGDLPYYVDVVEKDLGTPTLIVCLDSGCGNYEQLWCTTSLRGLVVGTLRVDLLKEGVHSGDAGGVVASSFRVIRQLLSRIEDEKSGAMPLPELNVAIPDDRLAQAKVCAEVLGTDLASKYPLHEGVSAMHKDPVDIVLGRTWRPALAVTGAGGLPALADAGNVTRPHTALMLAIRVPPTADAERAAQVIRQTLTNNPPYGAKVSFDGAGWAGWNAPRLATWLETSIEHASMSCYGKPSVSMGEGGSIPFMGMLGAKFPQAQFVITGVLGPGSNAHGPNEFLHIPMGKRVTASVACILADHAARPRG